MFHWAFRRVRGLWRGRAWASASTRGAAASPTSVVAPSTGGSATSARTAAAKASAVVVTRGVHGVRRRQRCCEHGRSRSQCKEGGGSGICEHGRRRNDCRECGGSCSASTCDTVWLAKNAAAAASRCRLRARPAAQRVQGVRRQRHLRARAGAQCTPMY